MSEWSHILPLWVLISIKKTKSIIQKVHKRIKLYNYDLSSILFPEIISVSITMLLSKNSTVKIPQVIIHLKKNKLTNILLNPKPLKGNKNKNS